MNMQCIYVQHAHETSNIPSSMILGKMIQSAEFKPHSVLLCCSFTHLAQCSPCPVSFCFFPHPGPLFSLLLWFYFTLPPFPSHHRFESLKICLHTAPLFLSFCFSLALFCSLLSLPLWQSPPPSPPLCSSPGSSGSTACRKLRALDLTLCLVSSFDKNHNKLCRHTDSIAVFLFLVRAFSSLLLLISPILYCTNCKMPTFLLLV